MATKMRLPDTMYVRREENYFLAHDEVQDSVADDGPTVIGVYELIREIKATKRVEIDILRTASQKSHSSNRK